MILHVALPLIKLWIILGFNLQVQFLDYCLQQLLLAHHLKLILNNFKIKPQMPQLHQPLNNNKSLQQILKNQITELYQSE